MDKLTCLLIINYTWQVCGLSMAFICKKKSLFSFKRNSSIDYRRVRNLNSYVENKRRLALSLFQITSLAMHIFGIYIFHFWFYSKWPSGTLDKYIKCWNINMFKRHLILKDFIKSASFVISLFYFHLYQDCHIS